MKNGQQSSKLHFFHSMAITGCLFLASASQAQSLVDQINSAITDTTLQFSMRFRHETVVQDNALSDAAASTVRTRVSMQSGSVEGVSTFLEVDNVTAFGADHYDSFVIDEYRGKYSVIADPTGTEINQAFLQYQTETGWQSRLGRQRILHAGQRFVGGVGWRQNEQTFDALSGRYENGPTSLDYSYVWNVNRIFKASSPSVQATDLDSNSHFLLASRRTELGVFSGFLYALDFRDARSLSSVTAGASYSGDVGPVSIVASLARQSDYADNPANYTGNYLNFEAGLPLSSANRVLLGYEILGSDNGTRAFATPLATLHKWQGWTDLFLGTPDTGIRDTYMTLTHSSGKLSLAATWHDFKSDYGNADYGREWDLIGTYVLSSHFNAQLKYASYDRDSYAVDTDKLWLTLNVVF